MKAMRRFSGSARRTTLGIGLVALLVANAPAETDRPRPANTRVIGTYFGAAMPHTFDLAPNSLKFEVQGLLFTFSLSYNPLGYYQTSSGNQVIAFARGRAWTMQGSFVSVPFEPLPPGISEFDLWVHLEGNFSGQEAEHNGTRLASLEDYWGDGVMNFFKKTDGVYFTDPVQYKGTMVFYQRFTDESDLFQLPVVQNSGPVGIDIEAKKVSNSLNGRFVPRVKVRR